MKATTALTRAPYPTSNGRTQWKGTSRPYWPQFTVRTSYAQTLGPMPSDTGNSVPQTSIKNTPARIIDPCFRTDAYTQFRHGFGDLLCNPLQDHERLWKFDVKNDIGFYMGDKDGVKGGSIVYMPYTHSTLVRGNGHCGLISDLQLLQWYSPRRREI